MRVGTNPEKANPRLEVKNFHRVIMPVYIPNLEGYFNDALRILEVSLNSLFRTLPEKTVITIIDNNSCDEVKRVLSKYRAEGKIDRLIINETNEGKIDPIIGAARSCFEPLITFTDADVFFKDGWFQEALTIFSAFPECGMVGYTPDPVKLLGFTDSTLLRALFSSKVSKIESNTQDRDFFARSIGIKPEIYYKNVDKAKLTVIMKGGVTAVIGSHHFVCTLNRNFLDCVPRQPSLKKITGNSELHYIDKPVDEKGFLKLSTTSDMVYHLGNVWEDWMAEKGKDARNTEIIIPRLKQRGTIGIIPYWLRNKTVTLIFRTRLRRLVHKF